MSLIVLAVLIAFLQATIACRIIRSGLTEEEKDAILMKHNEYRNLVAEGATPNQPPAQNMIQLVWHEEAADRAQLRSNTCEFEHDTDLDTSDGERMGQNLAQIMSSDKNMNRMKALLDMVKMWYDEYKYYAFGSGFKHNTGHYTQLAWASTEGVGCGFTIYQQRRNYNYYLTCNYYKAGNYAGQKPYARGKKNCQNYKLNDSNEFSALCEK